MEVKKQDLFDKLAKVNAELSGLHVLLHRLEETPDLRFEIGKTETDGKTKCIYSSRSINRTLNEYAENEYTEEKGYHIDVWENDSAAADITIHGNPRSMAKVVFEINKKTLVRNGTVMEYVHETIYKSSSPSACTQEWHRRGCSFTAGYVMDIREAPDGKETYHVADIDIQSIALVPRSCGRDWLIQMIESRKDSCDITGMNATFIADIILDAYGRGKA